MSMEPQPTTLVTVNPEEINYVLVLWDPIHWSIITFQVLHFTSVATGEQFKRLGPQIEVNQRGYCILHWGERL